jgi:hypothetical protein
LNSGIKKNNNKNAIFKRNITDIIKELTFNPAADLEFDTGLCIGY